MFKSVMISVTAKRIVVVEVLLNLKRGHIPDEELVLQVQRGESEPFAELASRYLPVIHRVAAPYRSGLMEAEDLSQEGLIGLFCAAETYRPENTAAFSTYAGVCISNRIVSAARKVMGKKRGSQYRFVSIDEQDDGETSVQQNFDVSRNPEEFLLCQESLGLLLHLIQKELTEMEQQVLACYVSGFSYKEISDRMGISVKAVGNAIQRARRKLRVVC